jgi:hypothetical protein
LSSWPEWRDARIQVLSFASNNLMKAQTEKALAQLIPEIRIEADIEVMVRSKTDNIQEAIRQKSFDADVVFLGLAAPEEGGEEAYALRVRNLVDCLPTCFLVHNGSLFIGELVSQQEEAPESSQPQVSSTRTRKGRNKKGGTVRLCPNAFGRKI